MTLGGGPAGWHPRLTAWVDRVEGRWRDLGVPEGLRTAWRRDLVVDLAQARLEGVALQELLAVDPVRFADDVAVAQAPYEVELAPRPVPGAPRPEVSATRAFVMLAFAGALVGGFVSLVTVYPLGLAIIDALSVNYEREGVIALGMHALAGLLAATGGAVSVGYGYRDSPRRTRLALAAGGGLLAAGALAVGPAVAIARSTGYSTNASTMTLELVVVVAICAAVMHAVARLAAR